MGGGGFIGGAFCFLHFPITGIVKSAVGFMWLGGDFGGGN